MVERDRVRRAYDDLAATYADHRSGGGMAILDRFFESFGTTEGCRVLDAGCGQGRPVLGRLEGTTTAVGVDFSREQLQLARSTVPDASLLQGDMTALPFATGTFDAVVAYWSIIHVPLAEHGVVVDEFARVLRPGGRLLLCEGAEEWAGENPDWLDSGVGMQWGIAGAEATRSQLRDAGFEILDTWGAPETLEDEADTGTAGTSEAAAQSDGESDDDADPWVFFGARLGTG